MIQFVPVPDVLYTAAQCLHNRVLFFRNDIKLFYATTSTTSIYYLN